MSKTCTFDDGGDIDEIGHSDVHGTETDTGGL